MQKQVSDHTTGTVQPQVLQLGFDHNTVDLGSQVGFMQPPQPMDNTHTHTQSQQTPQSPSPRSQWPDGNGGPSRNGTRLHDQASFKGLQDQQANAQALHDDLQKGNGDARMMGHVRNTSWADMSNRTTAQVAPQLFTPDYSDIMYRSASIGEWTDDILSQSQPQPQSQSQSQIRRGPTPSGGGMLPSPYPSHSARPAADNPASSTDESTATCGTPPPSLSHGAVRNGTLGEKFEFMLECTQAVGSDNFDSLAIAYYTGKFGTSTPLANEQRLSRNRGLPKLIGEVHKAAKDWSDWEKRGFYDEVFKTTELCLMSEIEKARQSFRDVLTPLVAAQDCGNGPADAGADSPSVVSMKRVIEDEVPNVWALLMALSASSEDSDVWQRNRSNTVLAAIVILRYAGRVSNEQLFSLLGAVL